MIVFFCFFEKRIVSVKQLELESVHQILNVPSLLFSETHGVSGCDIHKFRWQSQCFWGTWESESGSVLLQNFSFTQQKRSVEAIPPISRRKVLLKRRAGTASLKQPLLIKILPPSQEGRLLNLCAANPDCQELLSCHCCAVTVGTTKKPLHLP